MIQAETQGSISRWAVATFGDAGTNLRVAQRAREEMKELIDHLEADDNAPEAAAEIADIIIVLYRLADRMGIDLHDAIDEKMAVNRKRRWNIIGRGGIGYHEPATQADTNTNS